MVTWILTSVVIAAFSAAAMELLREESPLRVAPSAGLLGTGASHIVGGTRSDARWETMNDSELDALLEEFSRAGDELVLPDSQGSF